MERVNRRATFLLLLLVLLVAPVANVWCSTVCVAAAISGGCAHGLQPTDDLPMEKAAPAASEQWTALAVPETSPERVRIPHMPATAQRTPLRL